MLYNAQNYISFRCSQYSPMFFSLILIANISFVLFHFMIFAIETYQYLHWELRMFQTEKCKCIKSNKVLDLYLVGGVGGGG